MGLQQTNDVAAQLLIPGSISLLAVVVLAGLLGVLYVRNRRLGASVVGASAWGGIHSYRPSVFEQTCRWVAVKGCRVSGVQSALGLYNAVPCSWDEGISRLTTRSLFVSPPVRGWILVVGEGLPDPSEDVDRCFHFLTKLSRSLGDVQFFSMNRAANHHSWARLRRGCVERAYVWAGGTLWNQGQPTRAEIDLGMKLYAYGEDADPFQSLASDLSLPNSDKVLSLAGRWSVDPASIHATVLHTGFGVAGDLARPHLS